jgi:dTDP-4-dehydrorhamnose 3,5-epimerase
MKLLETPIAGVLLLQPEPIHDVRGYFAESFHTQALAAAGVESQFVRANESFNHTAGTLRGLHAQQAPHAEDKLVRCLQGEIFDVAVDARPGSPTLGQWFGATLTAENGHMLYIPKGCFHGYLTLCDQAKILYLVTGNYHPKAEMGLLWNDPAIGIEWPDLGTGDFLVSEKDQQWPTFAEWQGALTV